MLAPDVVDKKMIGLWQMFNLPSLQATVIHDTVKFTFKHKGAERNIIAMPTNLFMHLEPVEIRDVLEGALSRYYGIDGKIFRSDLRGFSKNPFSSQN